MASDVHGLVDNERGLVSRRIFVEPDIYQQELERIFARCWLFLGHESQIPRPGDFFTTFMGEDGVIVTRDAHGQIQGLLNSCRHRGNRVCRLDQGRAHSFMCTYHGWTPINCRVFPNLSLSSSSMMLHVWHPKGPLKTEVWLYTLVDKDAPPEVKRAYRQFAERHFSPSGIFEQDDGENWEQSTLACMGAVARRYPLHYGMGIGHETLERTGEGPARWKSLVNEKNQRVFYQRWAEVMAAESWSELAPAKSTAP